MVKHDDAADEEWVYPPHTKAKHDILASYMDGWFPILGARNGRIIVLDGFAGRGRYRDGSPGSPLIVLDHLLKHRRFSAMTKVEFIFLFVEKNAANLASLKREVAQFRADHEPWPSNVRYEIIDSHFEQTAREVVADLTGRGERLAPTFAFIDPFGFKGMPMDAVADLLNEGKCEVFANFMIGSVNRFLHHPNETTRAHINDLFGLDVAKRFARDFKGGDRVEFLRDLYAEQLRAVAGFTYVQSFAMINSTGNVVYYLFHGTRHPAGVKLMKSAMWKADPGGTHRFSDRLAGQDVLFVSDPDLGPLAAAILKHFRGRTGVTADALEEFALLQTPYRETHVRPVLRALEKADPSPITVNRPAGKTQYAPGVTIDFPV